MCTSWGVSSSAVRRELPAGEDTRLSEGQRASRPASRAELCTLRKIAQALLETLDAARVTLRLPDERLVLCYGR